MQGEERWLLSHTKALSKTLNHYTHTEHTHTHRAHNAGSPQRGKHVPIVRGSHEPPCSFSPDNSCIDNTYQLVRYKRKGRRHRKGTKRGRRKKALQPVNGYPFTSLPCGTFVHIRTAKSCVGATFPPLIGQKKNKKTVHSWKSAELWWYKWKKESGRGRYNLITFYWLSVSQSFNQPISRSFSQPLMGEVGHAQNKLHGWVTAASINQSIWKVIHTSTPSSMEILCKPAVER